MNNTSFNTRIKQKRDTAANWEKIKNSFSPLDGEIIIVDTSAGDTRLKIGRYDVSKSRLLTYAELPFLDEKLYNTVGTKIGNLYDEINEKATKDVATQSINGLMSYVDKKKIDNLDSTVATAVNAAVADIVIDGGTW